MGRRVVIGLMAAMFVVLVAACETTERLEIHADGSATATSTWQVRRGDPVFAQLEVDFDELVAEAGDGGREQLARLLALNLDDAMLDGLRVDSDDQRIVFEWQTDFADLDELADFGSRAWPFIPLLITLLDVTVSGSGNTTTLAADVPDTISGWFTGVLALPDGPFSPAFTDDPGTAAYAGETIDLELSLPGRIVSHDAHDVDGNTLRWSWTVGEEARTGITATWDPRGGPDPGFDWWGRDQAIVFGFLAFGLLVLIVAGSLGFLGFTRKVEKEGRRVRSGRWPNR